MTGDGSLRPYVPARYAEVFEKFTIEEIHRLLSKGNLFFENHCALKKSAMQFLTDNPEFAEVFQKW